MIAYRAETSMASLLREHQARGGDDARALLRQIFHAEADLTPDLAAHTLDFTRIRRSEGDDS